MLKETVILSLTLGLVAGTSQTLTSTFQFTASGLIGTPATSSTPFQGKTFTNAAITITAVGNTANRVSCCTSGFYIPNDSASISIAGIGTFRLTSQTFIVTNPTIDPVKGVTGVEYGFYRSIGNNPWWGVEDFNYPQSSSWSMEQSVGPIATTIETSGWNLGGSGLATNGGTLQLSDGGSIGTFQATFAGTPPAPTLTRSGVFSHIAAGGGWATTITLVNATAKAQSVSVNFHNDDGSALSLPLSTTNQGLTQSSTSSSVSASINPNASLLITTGTLASLEVGWADVTSTGALGGFAIFRQTPTTGSPSEGTVLLLTTSPTTITLPYDNTNGFVMGVALANLSSSSANVTATIWDDSGNQLGTQYITIAGNGHSAFVLPIQIALTTGKRGIVQFLNSGGLAGLGLRFSPFGTFTDVPVM